MSEEEFFVWRRPMAGHQVNAHVVDMRPRKYIEIEDYGYRLSVKDARALRDWLNEVLP